jgi:TIR domain/WD domain, G-beta repeat
MGGADDRNFDVFLCYNKLDKEAVRQIGERLRERDISPWFDEWGLRPGHPWQQCLEEQIAQIKTVAVFVGKNGLGPWQRQELNAFLEEFVRRNCPVIPVLLANAPRRKPALPPFLQAMTWVDFRTQDPDPMLQLLWGITGSREVQSPPSIGEVSLREKFLSRRVIFIGLVSLATATVTGGWLLSQPSLFKPSPTLPYRPTGTVKPTSTATDRAVTLPYTYKEHESEVLSIAWAPRNNLIASGDSLSRVRTWNVTTGKTIFVSYIHGSKINAVAWSPDGTRLASASADNNMMIWQATNGDYPTSDDNRVTYKSSYEIKAVAWSPNGQFIAFGGFDKIIHVHDARTKELLFECQGHSEGITAIAWSPNGQWIASGGYDQTARLWNATNGEAGLIYRRHSSAVLTLAWSPDNTRIVTGDSDSHTVQVWNPTNGDLLINYTNHELAVRSVMWSPDGKRIASGSVDRTVQVWDALHGTMQMKYIKHATEINAVVWSPDSKLVASGGNDKLIQIWSAQVE